MVTAVKSRKQKKPRPRYFFWLTFVLLALGAALVGTLTGLVLAYGIDLPEVEDLQRSQPSVVSYVYASDGRVLGQFALEKRRLVTYEEIPLIVKHSILAIEDANFFEHPGIDLVRLFITIVRDIAYGERKGASTLTMQLSKLRFTSTEITFERKIKDMLFAIQIERAYSKEEIFTFYCNQIYMGHNRYGVAAAANFYFQKSLSELSYSEAGVLAGLIRSPVRNSPINHPEQAMGRRNLVLRRAYDEGFISAETYRECLQEPLQLNTSSDARSPAPYFVEWVRQYLEERYTTDRIYKGGLRVYTTLDYEQQEAAQQALQQGLKKFDKKRRWQSPGENILDQGKDLQTYVHPDWKRLFFEGQMVHGLVLESSPTQARVQMGSYTALIHPTDIVWTKKKKVDQALKPGDLAVFTLQSIDRSNRTIEATLDRIPEVQGAIIAIENQTGAIRAMVGGFDFEASKFNRAMQAERQPGSVFKIFTYVAAVEAGYSPDDTVLDAPVDLVDGLGRPYAPENYDEKYKGLITIRQALAESRNVPTIRLANALGVDALVEAAHRFGIQRDLPAFLSLALGAAEVTLAEMASAFSVFPNNGVRVTPYFIDRVEDTNGILLERENPKIQEVISPETAETMIGLLRGVVQRGTAGRARVLKRPVGGKTGTTNDSTDSWFVGFTPQIAAGVWVGYDEKKSLGEKVVGSNLALPIWIEFMKGALRDTPPQNFVRTGATPTNPDPDSQAEEAAEGESPPQEPSEQTPKNLISIEDIPPPPGSVEETKNEETEP